MIENEQTQSITVDELFQQIYPPDHPFSLAIKAMETEIEMKKVEKIKKPKVPKLRKPVPMPDEFPNFETSRPHHLRPQLAYLMGATTKARRS